MKMYVTHFISLLFLSLSAMDGGHMWSEQELFKSMRDQDTCFSLIPRDVHGLIATYTLMQQKYEKDVVDYTEYIGEDSFQILGVGLYYLENSPLVKERFLKAWNTQYAKEYEGAPYYPLFTALLNHDVTKVKDEAAHLSLGFLNAQIEGYTPLEIAFRYENQKMAKCLLEAKADIERAYDGRSPLMYAIKNQEYEVVTRMIACGADVNARDSQRKTPLHYAAKIKDLKYVQLLLEKGAPLAAVDSQLLWPLHKAIDANNVDVITFFLDKLTLSSSLLHEFLEYAVDNAPASYHAMKVLCARGASIDAANRANGSTLLTQAIYDRDEQKVRTLLALGADPTVPDLYDTMPIALAREWEFYAIMALLTQAIEFTQLNIPLEEVFF